MKKKRWFFLHGFLGKGSDWEQVIPKLTTAGTEIICPDLFAADCEQPLQPFKQWADDFAKHYDLSSSDYDNYIVGYSLGGRLALHLLAQFPQSFKHAFLVSTNPGGFEPEDRKQWEAEWAAGFRKDAWELLLRDWGQQRVFCGSRPQPRIESDYSRERLAEVFETWSSTCHDFSFSQIQTPITWLIGSHDTKYMSLMGQMRGAEMPGEFVMVKGAGHRVPWDEPEQFRESISSFTQ